MTPENPHYPVAFPPLEASNRAREFNSYSDSLKARVIRGYLFHGQSHRELDRQILGLDPKKSRGWQSMGILHYLGLKNHHQGIFQQRTETEVKEILQPIEVGRIDLLKHLLGLGEAMREAGMTTEAKRLEERGVFDPKNLEDARKKSLVAIASRRGQPKFRKELLAAYRGRCAVTGCNAEAALEAAHIVGYRGESTNHPQNGILLRADIHTIFDCRLFAVDIRGFQVVISTGLLGTTYEGISKKKLAVPRERNLRPSLEALQIHRSECGF